LNASSALAGDRHWNVPSGSWNAVTNWNPAAIPGSVDNAVIDFRSGAGTSGIALVNSDVGRVQQVYVYAGNRVDVVTRGVLRTFADVIVGFGTSQGSGQVTVSSNSPTIFNRATLEAGRNMRLGVQDGDGHVHQSADFVTVNGDLFLGTSNVPTNPGQPLGIYNLSGGNLTVGGTVFLGADPSGSVGEFTLRSPAVANVGGIRGIYTGFVHHLGGEMHVGQAGLTFPSANGGAFMRYTVHDGEFTSAKVTVNNAGEWEIRGGFVSAGHLAVNGGRVVISEPGPIMIHTLDVQMTDPNPTLPGFIDLYEGGLTTQSDGPEDSEAVRVLIQRGYRNGLWTSGGGIDSYQGITSRAAGDNASSAHKTALGYGDTLDLFTGAGPTEGGSSIIVKYTFYGDANLDGAVNLQDFNRLASNFGASGKFWPQGDFNYDKLVNLQDFNLFAANFGISASGPEVTAQDWSRLAAAVPEPASLALTGLAMLALRRRRHPLA
jgi:hypothetical protein